MKYLIISNKGEIKEQALTMIGLSTKRNDSNKIGRFGSGNKYALAYLLRNNIEFYIYSGINHMSITTNKETFNSMEYHSIVINDKSTSLTTDMGPDWVFWFAVREIYCNALDEGDMTINVFDTDILGEFTHNPLPNKTTYIINITDDFHMDRWDMYFSETRKPIVIGFNANMQAFSIYSKIDNHSIIYKKGIRCVDINDKKISLYDYDFSEISINESRVVAYDYLIEEAIAYAFCTLSDVSIMENVLANCKDSKLLESKAIDRNSFNFSPESYWAKFLDSKKLMVDEVCGRYIDRPDFDEYYKIPFSFAKKIKGILTEKRILGTDTMVGNDIGKVFVQDEEVPKRLSFLVNQCISEMKEHWEYDVKYPIRYFEQPFMPDGSLKMAEADVKNNIILLNIALQKFGKKEIAMALIEECEHIESKAGDETRGFQNQLIRTLVFVLERNSGFFM